MFRKMIFASLVLSAAAACAADNRVTHGPILGRPAADSMGVWVRTERPGSFHVRYGVDPANLDQTSAQGRTLLEADVTGWVTLEGLKPDTRYHYAVVVDGGAADAGATDGSVVDARRGAFRTLARAQDFVDADVNPRGLFNFSFEFGCCNDQPARGREKIDLPIWETALRTHGDRIHFSIQNGDWCYEEMRDYPAADWLRQVGLSAEQTPEVVRTTPLVVGAWENYKLYLERSDSLTRWHQNVPSLFTFDDHEILDDAAGAGTVGARPRRALYRDIGVRAWYDYLGWANPADADGDIHFGIGQFLANGNVLIDEDADFSALVPSEQAELHVHWGGPNATRKEKEYDADGGDPNAGVYEVVRVIDRHRLEIRPAARADGTASYSIGRFSYFKQTVSNCDFFYVDTRGHRDVPEDDNPKKEGISLLGARQKAWLKREMAASHADCFFVVSTVNFMIPHVVDVSTAEFTNHVDSWPAFWREREEMIDFFDGLGKKVFILTGDLHVSFAIQVTDNVWEFASAPHSSGNAGYLSGGGYPPNGVFDSYGRECFVRWSTWFDNRVAPRAAPKKVYCIVNVNNVFNNPIEPDRARWQAYPYPQVVFQYHDGPTGDLLYAESVLLGDAAR